MDFKTILLGMLTYYFAGITLSAEDELPSVERSRGVLAEGTEWETPWFVADTGRDGPVVMITGGVHGNEPAGAYAADQIRHWPLKRGKLIVVPKANRKALEARKRRTPELPEAVGDLNRAFPKTGQPNKARTELASALWEFAGEIKPDWVIDLHEGKAVHRKNPDSAGSAILCLATGKTRPLFERALGAVNTSVADPENHFVLMAKSRIADGSFARAARERLGATATILETTYNGFPLAVRIRQHRLMVNQILTDLNMVDAGADDLVFAGEKDGRIRVAIYVDAGVWGAGPRSIKELLNNEPDRFLSRIIGSAEIRAGGLDAFDIVIFPGGSGSKQAAGLGEPGREKVREFVEGGGGYIGICAGCYLACENFSWSLKILDAKTKSSKWNRGRKDLQLDFDRKFVGVLGIDRGSAKVKYANGPVMAPAGSPEIPDFTTWATYTTEVAENGTPKGIQIGSPAILAGSYGEGRVLGVSPHPELTPDLQKIVPEMVEWVAGKEGAKR